MSTARRQNSLASPRLEPSATRQVGMNSAFSGLSARKKATEEKNPCRHRQSETARSLAPALNKGDRMGRTSEPQRWRPDAIRGRRQSLRSVAAPHNNLQWIIEQIRTAEHHTPNFHILCSLRPIAMDGAIHGSIWLQYRLPRRIKIAQDQSTSFRFFVTWPALPGESSPDQAIGSGSDVGSRRFRLGNNE